MLTLPLPTRSARRRAVVVLWTAFAAYLAAGTRTSGDDVAGALGALAMLVGFGCLFSIARAVRWGQADVPGKLDERETAARDRAHYLAFQVQSAFMLAVVVYATVAVRVDGMWLPASAQQAASALAAVAVAMGLLPVTLIAWREPDAPLDEDEPAPARPSLRYPVARGARMVIGAMVAAAGVLALLTYAGVGPVPADEAGTMAGLASGMLVMFLATRTADPSRA